MPVASSFPAIMSTQSGCALVFARVLHNEHMRHKEHTGSLEGLKLLTFEQLRHNGYA